MTVEDVDASTNADGSAALLLALAGVALAPAAAPRIEWRCTGEQFATGQGVRGTAELTADGARVRFESDASGGQHHLRLSIPALPGTYVFNGFEIDEQSIVEPARYVVSAHDAWVRLADASIAVSCVSGRPFFELDLSGFSAADEQQGRQRIVSVSVTRQRSDSRVGERISADVAELLAAVRRLQIEQARSAMGQMESQAQQMQRVAEQATRSSEESLYTRDVMQAIAASIDECGTETARILARQQDLSDRLDAMDVRMASLVDDLRHRGDAEAARFARVIEALDAGRQSDSAERQRTRDLVLGSISALGADIGDVRSALQNVFWRRWMRALRRGRGAP